MPAKASVKVDDVVMVTVPIDPAAIGAVTARFTDANGATLAQSTLTVTPR